MTNLSLRAFRANTRVPVAGGIRTPMRNAGFASVRPWLGSNRLAAETWWLGQSMTPLITNGPVGAKLTIAVVGDGFAAADQTRYNDAVNNLLINGMFTQDFFAANKTAFNVYRINLESADSGVSTKTYDANGNVINQVDRNTALNLYYSGDWGHCWLEGGPNHERALTQALSIWLPDYTYVLVLLNNPNFGGCGGGGRAYVPLGVSWSTIAHEFGHAFGLADEYCGGNAYTSGEPGAPNLTRTTSRSSLKWSSFVQAATPLPTGSGACAGYTAGPKPHTWNDNRSVGLFEGGGGGFNTGIYRPVLSCRMNTNDPPFCPVCRQVMDARAAPHLRRSSVPAPQPGDDTAVNGVSSEQEPVMAGPAEDGYVRMVVHYADGQLSVTDAREVDGPLVQPATLSSGLAHELRVGDRPVAVGSMPDAATNRSFSEIGPSGPQPHHIYQRDEFDFVVRVPRAALRGADPASIAVELVEIRTDGRLAQVSGRPLTEDPALNARPVASLGSLAASGMPDSLRQVIEETS